MSDCGRVEVELDEAVEPFGLVVVAVPLLGVWFCGAAGVVLCSGVAVFSGGFSGEVVVEVDGLATLLDCDDCVDALPVLEDDTPGPSCADGLHVSAMCFTLVTAKLLFDIVEDCVLPVLLADAEAVDSLPVVAPISSTLCPTWSFRSAVEPFS